MKEEEEEQEHVNEEEASGKLICSLTQHQADIQLVASLKILNLRTGDISSRYDTKQIDFRISVWNIGF